MNSTKCFIDSDSECLRLYRKEFQGSDFDSREPMLRLIVPIDDIRGKHVMVKYEGEISFDKVDRFLKDFYAGKQSIKIDIKSERPKKKFHKKYSSLVHLSGEEYLKRVKQVKRSKKDSIVFFYRSNLKKDLKALKEMNVLAKEMKKLKNLDVEFFAYDVVKNAQLNFRHRMKSLPGINLYLRDYELTRNASLLKADRQREVMLFLNDRLTTDYSMFFIGMSH